MSLSGYSMITTTNRIFFSMKRCSSCDFVSERKATFYELDLTVAGHSTLERSFDDFFKVEYAHLC